MAGQNLGAPRHDRTAAAGEHSAREVSPARSAWGAVFSRPGAAGHFGIDTRTNPIGNGLRRVIQRLGLFISAPGVQRGSREPATPKPLYISIVSQILLPLGICFVIQQMGTLRPMHIWLAILAGHATRFTLSALRFSQGKWRGIQIDIGPESARGGAPAG